MGQLAPVIDRVSWLMLKLSGDAASEGVAEPGRVAIFELSRWLTQRSLELAELKPSPRPELLADDPIGGEAELGSLVGELDAMPVGERIQAGLAHIRAVFLEIAETGGVGQRNLEAYAIRLAAEIESWGNIS